MHQHVSIVWFRQDLRLEDNPALQAALNRGGTVIPLYIWAPEEEGRWAPGRASRWWLHQSLKALDEQLQHMGSRLIIREGHSFHCIKELIEETHAQSIYWNRRYEPESVHRDTRLKAHLRQIGIITECFNSALLSEPWELKTKQSTPFQVFYHYWNTFQKAPEPQRPLPAPKRLPAVPAAIHSVSLDSLRFEFSMNRPEGIHSYWQPGEKESHQKFKHFLSEELSKYFRFRDRPDISIISHLSPHLHFGEISPRRIWHDIKDAVKTTESKASPDAFEFQKSAEEFLRQLGWREFAYHLLYHFPHTTNEPMRPAYKAFPWKEDPRGLEAWQAGLTGFPIVDAGMRELRETGWMHNRLRMIVASFLVKDLLIPWQQGARWFWDTLVDADLANNTLGWQWTAGCGSDSAPYFRIFNPVTQGEKFDPKGIYVRRWIPELAKLPDVHIHRPWEASPAELHSAGVILGKNYPFSIIDHAEARERALRAFEYLKL